MRRALVVAVLVLAGCQSFSEGMKVVCDAPTKVDPKLEPADKAAAIATVIQKDLTNKEVLDLIRTLGASSPEDKDKGFADAVKRAGLSSCPLLDEGARRP